MVVKDLVWAIAVLTRGTKIIFQSKERSGQCEVADSGANVIPTIFWSNTQFGFKNQNKNFELEKS